MLTNTTKRSPFGLPNFGGGGMAGRDMSVRETAPPGGQSAAPRKKKGGMFGSGLKGWDIVGILGDTFADEPRYGPAMLERARAKREAEAAEAEYQRRRGDALTDYEAKQEVDARYAKPTNNDTVADYEYIKATLGEEAAKDYLKNKANPPQWRQDYATGEWKRVDAPATSTRVLGPTLDDDWELEGGGVGNGPGGFPRRY